MYYSYTALVVALSYFYFNQLLFGGSLKMGE